MPPELGPIRFRYGWGCALLRDEIVIRPHDIRAVALIGDEAGGLRPARGSEGRGTKALERNVRWAANRMKYFVAVIASSGLGVGWDVVLLPAEDEGATVFHRRRGRAGHRDHPEEPPLRGAGPLPARSLWTRAGPAG